MKGKKHLEVREGRTDQQSSLRGIAREVGAQESRAERGAGPQPRCSAFSSMQVDGHERYGSCKRWGQAF